LAARRETTRQVQSATNGQRYTAEMDWRRSYGGAGRWQTIVVGVGTGAYLRRL
jgi:hypothetical protein